MIGFLQKFQVGVVGVGRVAPPYDPLVFAGGGLLQSFTFPDQP
jgi:hypothetical protein